MTARPTRPFHRAALAAVAAMAVASASAQTRITADKNKYTPAQDVQVGQQAADEVRRELPLLNDGRIDEYVAGIGRNLVRAIPPEFQHREFRYTFEVVNQKEINAFALPGGPMFLNRGMIEAAKAEGEVAGVMAHELSHVALRHGTAQATKGEKFQIGAIAGQILGAVVGGPAGSVIAQGSSFGLGAYFLKYGREYERQADMLGAQIMARAGYDPRRMADMFRTIEAQGGSQGPEWLSSHPNPGNRYEAIQREAATLRVEGTPRTENEFPAIQSRLRGMGPAYTAEQIARAKQSGRRLPSVNTGSSGNRRSDAPPARASNVSVEPPSGSYEQLSVGNFMRLSMPTNWRRVGDATGVTFAPEGAFYRSGNGQTGFTHGIQLGTIPDHAHNPQAAMEELVDGLMRSNPQIRRDSNGLTREVVSGRQALSTSLRNVSEVTGQPEVVNITTVPLDDENLLYIIAVTPRDELNVYSPAFRRVKQSVQLR
jgi:hypothetical protein